MPKYVVRATRTIYYETIVEAQNEDQVQQWIDDGMKGPDDPFYQTTSDRRYEVDDFEDIAGDPGYDQDWPVDVYLPPGSTVGIDPKDKP